MNNEPVRVLQILPGGHVCGGIENCVMNYYRNIDREKVMFDFLVHYKEKGYYDDEIERLGGKIYYFSAREDKNIFKYIKELRKFFREHPEYKIVHGHMPGFAPIYFFVAKCCGVKYRISHSHSASTEPNFKGLVLKCIVKSIRFFANIRFACATEAGKFMYGKKEFVNIKNAVNAEKFLFDKEIRDDLRKKLDIEDKFVIGNVGRFNVAKNHDFLIDVFSEVKKKKPDSVLLLVGEGELQEQIKSKIDSYGLAEDVLFCGISSNVDKLYQAMDCFVLPSIFEGLAIVAVEAQASGLKCVCSDKVPNEAKITDLVEFIALDESPEKWADKILEAGNGYERRNMYDEVVASGYNIEQAADKLKDIYLEIAGNNK